MTVAFFGTSGDDELIGTDARDILLGGLGNDTLNGGNGNDLLIGSSGNDLLAGAGGSDRYLLRPGEGTDFIEGFQDGQDLILLGGGLTFDQLTITPNSEFSSRFDISVTSTGEVLATVAPAQNNTQLTAADFISVYEGTFRGDVYQLGAEQPLAYGRSGNDTLYGSDLSNDTLYGGYGDDFLSGAGGRDILVGGWGNDIFDGGDGNDFLIGGYGNDALAGGGGSDRYLLRANQGTDIIEGFEDGTDLIVLGGGLTFDQLTITPNADVPSFLDISITNTGELLATIAPSQDNTQLTAADFITILL